MPTIINGNNGVDKVTDNTLVVADAKSGEPVGFQKMQLFAAQATTSGTNIDITGIPSWAKKVTVMLSGVSTNGTSPTTLRLGTAGGVDSAGYVGSVVNQSGATTAAFSTSFQMNVAQAAADTLNGIVELCKVSGDTWVMHGNLAYPTGDALRTSAGSKALTGSLDRIRLTTNGGTDTFDAGTISILVEGYE